jgi:hypothetical protein
MAQLTFGWFSRPICRDRRHRVDLSVAPGALTGVAESSWPRVADFGPCS